MEVEEAVESCEWRWRRESEEGVCVVVLLGWWREKEDVG